MINAEIIKERLLQIDENLKILDELNKINKEKFIGDPKIFKLAERCLEINIQAILDICHYLIANNNWERPNDNHDAIRIISQHKIIPKEFAKRIDPMVGFRNILAHEYMEIDTKKTYANLKNLADFRQFQKHIRAYLKSSR